LLTPTIFGVCRGEPMCSPQNPLQSDKFFGVCRGEPMCSPQNPLQSDKIFGVCRGEPMCSPQNPLQSDKILGVCRGEPMCSPQNPLQSDKTIVSIGVERESKLTRRMFSSLYTSQNVGWASFFFAHLKLKWWDRGRPCPPYINIIEIKYLNTCV